MESDSALYIAVLAVLILLSAYFSATETAFTSLNQIRMKKMASDGDKKAKLALKIFEDYDNLLSTILIGNNIVNIASASLATVIFTKWFQDAGVTISTVVMTVVVLIFGEISPKSIAKEKPESFSKFSAPIMRVMIICFKPVNFIFAQWKKFLMKLAKIGDKKSTITEEELKTIVDEVQQDGVIDSHEGELLRSALDFGDLEVSEILTPRVDVEAVEEDDSLEELERVFRESGFSRIPVYKETLDNITGVIYQKDFYNKRENKYLRVTDLMRETIYVSENMLVFKLLRLMQRSKVHMAVVVDEFGGTVGIITIEDILEELVGEIYDEHEEVLEEIRKVGENRFIIDCSINFEDMMEYFGCTPEEEYDFVTVSGWVMYQLGKIPEPGDTFTYQSFTVTVTKTDSRRVTEIELVNGKGE